MVYCRELFVDVLWCMGCFNIIGFVILVVAMKIGYFNS
jgi:hypothetical protein